MNFVPVIGLTSVLGVIAANAAGCTQTAAHPTIRSMAGVETIQSLQADKTAVLVIDFQNEYFPGGRMVIPDGQAALGQTRRIIDFADRHKIRVIHVRHVLPAGAPLFAKGGETVQFHQDMQPRSGELVITKNTVSVFAGDSGPILDKALKDSGIDTLIITGLQTHACVAGAGRDAVPRGYNVIVSADATATRELTLRDGSTIGHKPLHAAALAELEDTFGDVMTTDQVIALPVKQARRNGDMGACGAPGKSTQMACME